MASAPPGRITGARPAPTAYQRPYAPPPPPPRARPGRREFSAFITAVVAEFVGDGQAVVALIAEATHRRTDKTRLARVLLTSDVDDMTKLCDGKVRLVAV